MSTVISPCGLYRYRLERVISPLSILDVTPYQLSMETVSFIMLNPSIADATKDDPTIRRIKKFASDWGYGRVLVGNLFAYRATNPKFLETAEDPFGPDNYEHLSQIVKESNLVVCAWGTTPIAQTKASETINWLKKLKHSAYLKVATDGVSPCHPLYLPASLHPTYWPAT